MKRRLTSFLLVMAMVFTSFLQPLSVQAAGENTVEKENICVNTTVTVAGQYPVSIEVKVDDATGLDALTAADFTVAGQSAGWLTSNLHDFTATFKDVSVDGNVVTLTFGEFPERYPYVDNYTVTCAANEALTFKVTKDTQTFTPIADEFEQVRKADGGAYDYNLFTPADTSKAQPIVLVFHGFGDDENLYHNRLATAWADPANQAKRPAYVLAPMFGGYSMYQKSGREAVYEKVYATVQQMIADGQVDPNRVYVTGKSYGGGAVYEFLEKYPEFAAGAIAMCGQSTAPYNDVQDNLNKIVDVPLWIAHATEDPTVSITCSRDVYSKLVDLGSKVVKFTEYATDEMPAVAPDNKVVGPELNGIESLHGVESAVLEDQAYMEWLFKQEKEVVSDTSKIVDATYSVTVDEEAGTVEERAYKVYLPAGYTKKNNYPSVYLMPQDGYASKQYVDDGIQARLDELISSSAILPMVVVMPDFAEGDDYRALLPELVADVEADYSVIEGKNYRALLGVGVGGYMAFETAFISKSVSFNGYGSHMGDFTSDANPYKANGDVAAAVNKLGSFSLYGREAYYIDGPNGDPFTTVENGTTTIGAALMSKSYRQADYTEYVVSDGETNAEFYLTNIARSLGKFNTKFSASLVSGTLACTPQAVAASDDTITAKVKFNVNADMAKFVSVVPDIEVTVEFSDPASGAVTGTNSTTLTGLEVGKEATAELAFSKSDMAASTNTTATLYADIFGYKLQLTSITLVKIQPIGESDAEKQIDLMGNWYFQAYKSYRDNTENALDPVSAIVPEVYEQWEVVQPALGWWSADFAPSLGGNANYGGYAWYVRTFDMPEDFPTDGLLLGVGKFDEANEVFINGHFIGSNGMDYSASGTPGVGGVYDRSNPWDVNNVYDLDSSVLNYGGSNTIAVRMCNSSGGGGWYEGPVGIFSLASYNAAAGKPSTFASEAEANAILDIVAEQNAAIAAEDIDAYAATIDDNYFESGFDKDRRVAQMAEWFEAYDNLKVEDKVKGVFVADDMLNYQSVRTFTGTDKDGNTVAIVPPATEPDTIDENGAYEVYDYYKLNGDKAVAYGSHSRFYYDSYYSEATGDIETFRVYVPEGYFDADNAKRYPTMYLMHGINSQSKTFLLDKIDQIMDKAIAEGEVRETIVIIPDDPNRANSGWNTKMVANDLVAAADSTLRTIADARYRFTAGCSMGGAGSFNTGLNNPDKFSAVISFYGALSTGMVDASKEYLDQYDIFMVCGNMDMYGFYSVQENISRILSGKDVDHYHYVDNGAHDSIFYLPQFIKAVKYVEAGAYTTEGKAVDGAEGSVKVAGLKDGVKVDYSAAFPTDVLNYLDTVIFKDGSAETQALNIPVEVRVVQDGNIVASATDFYDLGPAKSRAKAAITFENSLELTSGAFNPKKAYTVDVYASVLEDTELIASKTVNAPAKVTNVKADLASYNSIKVSWDKAKDATEYHVYYKKSTTSDYKYYKKVTGTSTTLKNFAAGTKYNIKVVAVNDTVEGKASSVKSVTTLKKVTGVKVVRNGKKVTVSWKNIAGESGYQISRSTSKTGTANLVTKSGTSLTKANITLQSAGKRYYKVRAYKTVDGKKVYGPWSAVVFK